MHALVYIHIFSLITVHKRHMRVSNVFALQKLWRSKFTRGDTLLLSGTLIFLFNLNVSSRAARQGHIGVGGEGNWMCSQPLQDRKTRHYKVT